MAMANSDTLYSCATECIKPVDSDESISRCQFNDLVKNLVRLRHHCAHLIQKGGITPIDGDNVVEVRSYIGLLEGLARLSIIGRNGE